jgi:hypothetical protein
MGARTLPLLACALVLLEGALLMSPSALRTTHAVGYDCWARATMLRCGGEPYLRLAAGSSTGGLDDLAGRSTCAFSLLARVRGRSWAMFAAAASRS